MKETRAAGAPAYVPEETAAKETRSGKIDIPGVNSKLGLAIYEGDTDMYADILRSFAEDIPAELEKLRNVSEETLRLYAINVHTIRGSAAGIGAKALTERASRLEQTAKSGNLDGILAENESFLDEAFELIGNINSYFQAG
jgi:HPt (histidine-containing phosphotransfer) domain-containing protein